MSLSALLHVLPDRPDLRAQVRTGIPPQVLVLDGLQRSRNRVLDPSGAVSHSRRGRPAYLFSFGKCVRLSPETLARVFEDEEFRDAAVAGEASVDMYGRQHPNGSDTRTVVVTVAMQIV
jgi:hypothetical protein